MSERPALSRALCVGEELQTPGRRRGTEEEGTHAFTGLVPGCPLCADDGYALVRVTGSKRCDCPDQGNEEDNTAEDNRSDQCRTSGLFEWAEGKL